MNNIRVGCNTYKVVYVDGLKEKYSLFGQVNYDTNTIEIDSNLEDGRKINTIIHELTHAILFEAGYDEHSEEQVRRMSNVLTQVLMDNNFNAIYKGR